MSDISNENDYETPAVRPMFITVLCILTFIGSGLGIISAGTKFATANFQASIHTMQKEQIDATLDTKDSNNPGSQFAKKMVNSMMMSADSIRKWALADMAAAALCLAGALLMWKLKKTGFYLYLAGTVVGIAGPILLLGGSNFMAILSSLWMGFVGVIFVILYGLNFKYLK